MYTRNKLAVGGATLALVLGFSARAQAAYYSVLFGTDSQAAGDYSARATEMQNALLNWQNWRTANANGTMSIVNKDATITQALNQFSGTAAGANDFVLFLYYGHGGKVGNNVEAAPALDPSDERLSTYKNATGWTRETDNSVANSFAGLNNNARKLGIFTTCYAGGMWGEPGADLNKVPNTAMYASSTELQKTPDPDPFFAALVQSMADKSADLNHDNRVTVREWFDRAKAIVANNNPQFFYPNSPHVDDIFGPPEDITAEPAYFNESASFDSEVVAAGYLPEPASLGLVLAALSLGGRRRS